MLSFVVRNQTRESRRSNVLKITQRRDKIPVSSRSTSSIALSSVETAANGVARSQLKRVYREGKVGEGYNNAKYIPYASKSLTNSLAWRKDREHRQLRAKLALGFSRGNIGHDVCKQTRTHRTGGGGSRDRGTERGRTTKL